MKVNVPVRMKNIWFWIGIVGVILSAMGVSPEMFTSWEIVWQSIKDLFSNPFLLGSVIVAVIGVFNDPTTQGVKDSRRALGYKKPFKDV